MKEYVTFLTLLLLSIHVTNNSPHSIQNSLRVATSRYCHFETVLHLYTVRAIVSNMYGEQQES